MPLNKFLGDEEENNRALRERAMETVLSIFCEMQGSAGVTIWVALTVFGRWPRVRQLEFLQRVCEADMAARLDDAEGHYGKFVEVEASAAGMAAAFA